MCDNVVFFTDHVAKPEGWGNEGIDNWKDEDNVVYWRGAWSMIDGVPAPY